MLISIKEILPNGDIVIRPLFQTGEFPEKEPEQGEKYIVYFEKAEGENIPEFNRGK